MRLFFVIVALGTLTLVSAKPPNIVFLLTDDQTTNTLGCYGNPIVKTPNIDRLAEQGIRFENAFVSQSICWVSRASILSGVAGRSLGSLQQPDRMSKSKAAYIYPGLLKNSGYRTGFFGKWHAKIPKEFDQKTVFDVYQSINRNPFHKKMEDGSLRHETDLIVDGAIDFIQSQPSDQPFAINLWFNACHAEDGDHRPGSGHFPWPESANGLYESVKFAAPKLKAQSIFDAQPEFLQTSITRQRYFWRWDTPEKYQKNIQAYYRMVSGIDHAIGRLIQTLEAAGLADNTIIVYSADNGYFMGNRGFAGKWSHYEESLRVPLIIRDPRTAEKNKGLVSELPALNLDFASTFLDWAGVDIPSQYQGRSLQPIIEGATDIDWREETFHEHFAVRNRIPAFEGIRTSKFKYARYIDHDFEFLHDLENDPDELVNLANNSKYGEILSSLRGKTDRYVNQLGGELPPASKPFTKSIQSINH